MGFFRDFYNQGRFVKSLNAMFLVLGPKKGIIEDLRDFRPISLVSSLYKLLANRLEKMFSKVVSIFQNAFVEGRQILDVVLIASETINSMLKIDRVGVLCKLDIEKVYDHINWVFLLVVLENMGFSQRWISCISWYIFSLSFSVIVNCTPSGFFQSFRGLRQGDPLSPYFCLCLLWRGLAVSFKEQENMASKCMVEVERAWRLLIYY